MHYLSFSLGLLIGSVITFAFSYVFILVTARSVGKSANDSVLEFQKEANALLRERNRISLRQLEIMEAAADK